ncbi:hypothetical protein DR61_1372 [Burkholderia pseudomallei]|uniref:hypothetical protein n=1 Tax=Burkholderia pseudomallei TaxID=28450 RepID=UPI00050EC12D|nr:hypothetical protein [Burkholderia pseudomallei]AIS45539.1 hypothetical protein DR61_1372 [Burkholderia pseudomallei]KGD19975.1 hypothetical protein DR60_4440 [Burkholderia pseudomallei]CAJ3008801.1 Uncharacterised protein [Burkholderia pseudomallei]CAJ3136169.1 Uncharacterised protein [Burkholderia pseudomallei]CAJ3146157.1 Uncharacterised protein [Burkholderia pseudomallei]
MATDELNPQPLPPKVDLGQLTEAVTASVRKALEEHAVTENTAQVFRNPRIIIGIIMEPQALVREER